MNINEDKWDHNIERAKSLVNNKKSAQLEIATLALEVCEITWGGKANPEARTLNKFADEIGVNPKTLSSWCAIKRNLYDKLEDEVKQKVQWNQLYTTARSIPVNCTAKEANSAMFKVMYRAGPDNKICRYLAYLRSLRNVLNNPTTLALAKTETLEETLFWCQEIATAVHANSKSKNLKPKFKGLAGFNSKSVSIADISGISRAWRMNDTDQKVLDYLKSQKEFLPPIMIYRSALPTIKRNAAKLRSLRSLSKLLSMGHLIRNENGHYKMKNNRAI